MQFAQRGVWGGWKPHKYWGSLTIREGISRWFIWFLISWPFPHYTWGYIVTNLIFIILKNVPSLYVRVYRWEENTVPGLRGSLTIREGISELNADERIFLLFPHYTWGYIGRKVAMCWRSHVPSLYVRVYRQELFSRLYAYCSLTIREGISILLTDAGRPPQFPHYTWGYIAISITSGCL